MFKEIKEGNLFPLRFLGFGFFWAWLFLTAISPSPLFGLAVCVGSIPFEMLELGVRTILLLGVLGLFKRLATPAGCRLLLAASLVCGVAAVPCGLLGTPRASTVAAVLVAVADVGMFLLWLSFFGYMRLGDTLALLVCSYGVGSVLFLTVLALGRTAVIASGTLLPVLSCTAFVLSRRFQAARTGVPLFESSPSETLAAASQAAARSDLSRPRARMTLALGFYSCTFALLSSLCVRLGETPTAGYVVEPASIVVLAAVYVLTTRGPRATDKPYLMYRAVPVLVGLGFALFLAGAPAFAACACAAFGYVLFEVLALNDYCNIVHTEDASLLKAMALARLSISAGMALGWILGYGVAPLVGGVPSAAAALFLIIPASTLLFADRDVALMNALADDRAAAEAPAPGPSKQVLLERFAKDRGFSNRETEVFAYLIEGRTTTYAAGKLCVAESTVRAHVHGIYRKAQVNSRMELLDAFEEFQQAQEATPAAQP